ncbi:hypothetical protein BH20VER3_BH20VER3_13490 [soil metagenome]
MMAGGSSAELAAKRAIVVEILQQVLADPSQAAVYFKKWPSSVQETNPQLSGAWGALEHFCNDTDLRKKDPAYEEVLLRQLSEILVDLQKSPESGLGQTGRVSPLPRSLASSPKAAITPER